MAPDATDDAPRVDEPTDSPYILSVPLVGYTSKLKPLAVHVTVSVRSAVRPEAKWPVAVIAVPLIVCT
jgi:hypothetical protein